MTALTVKNVTKGLTSKITVLTFLWLFGLGESGLALERSFAN